MEISQLPTLNASLNALAALLMTIGYVMIRRRRIAAHRAFMLSACTASALFLVFYLIYHFHQPLNPFPGQGGIRIVYLTILFSHIALAISILPLVSITLYRALRGQFDRHRRIARWTLPIWMYVSVTGVIVYWMLYRMY